MQAAILSQLYRHQENREVRKAVIAGLEKGNVVYFKHALAGADVLAVIARKLLDPQAYEGGVFRRRHGISPTRKGRWQRTVRKAYTKKVHAVDPELRINVIFGLAQHGDQQRLPEAFERLVAILAEPPPPPADKLAEYARKRRIDHVAGWAFGIPRHFPPAVVAEFLHTKEADKQPAVQEAIKTLLAESGTSPMHTKHRQQPRRYWLRPKKRIRGRAVLRKLAEVNRFWLTDFPKEVRTLSYRFRLGMEEPIAVEVERPRDGGPSLRGMTYGSVLHEVVKDPEKIRLRAVPRRESQNHLGLFCAPGAIGWGWQRHR